MRTGSSRPGQGPEPRVNTKVGGIEVDLYWPERDLVVELDGPGHARPRTRKDDERRDGELRENGLRVVRIPSGHG
jgi:very-short-patch-repair endonuclease